MWRSIALCGGGVTNSVNDSGVEVVGSLSRVHSEGGGLETVLTTGKMGRRR